MVGQLVADMCKQVFIELMRRITREKVTFNLYFWGRQNLEFTYPHRLMQLVARIGRLLVMAAWAWEQGVSDEGWRGRMTDQRYGCSSRDDTIETMASGIAIEKGFHSLAEVKGAGHPCRLAQRPPRYLGGCHAAEVPGNAPTEIAPCPRAARVSQWLP